MPTADESTTKPDPVQIERRRVRSTNVHSVGYDDATSTLEVAFRPRKKGESLLAVYRYAPIAREFFDRLLEPGLSVGGAIHGMIVARIAATQRQPDELDLSVTTDEF